MKIHPFIIAFSIVVLNVKGDAIASCQNACFAAKQICNKQKSHTFNACDHDLFTCKASCNSGKIQEAYTTTLPITISFHPVLDFEG